MQFTYISFCYVMQTADKLSEQPVLEWYAWNLNICKPQTSFQNNCVRKVCMKSEYMLVNRSIIDGVLLV